MQFLGADRPTHLTDMFFQKLIETDQGKVLLFCYCSSCYYWDFLALFLLFILITAAVIVNIWFPYDLSKLDLEFNFQGIEIDKSKGQTHFSKTGALS